MGLADRFKKELETQSIFTKNKTINITKPELLQSDTLESVKLKVLNKIRKTPYWNDFSLQSKEKMISKYFDSKLDKTTFKDVSKSEYIKEVLAQI